MTGNDARSDGATAEGFRFASLGRHTLIYGAGILLNRAVAFVMLPIYTRFLTPADYGILQLIDMALEVLAIAAGTRIASGIYFYYHEARSDGDRRRVISTSLILIAASYATLGAMAWFGAPTLSRWVFQTAEYAHLVRIAAAGFAFNSLVIVPFSFFRVEERSGLYVGLSACKLALQLALNVLFVVYLGRAAEGVLLSTLLANALLGSVMAFLVVRSVGLRFSGAAARRLLRYGIPLIGTQVATFLATFADRYFIQQWADTSEVGIYGLAYQFGFLLAAIGYTPFNMVWEPVRFGLQRRPDRDAIYAKAFRYFNVLLFTAAVGIVLYVGDVLRIMSDPAFHRAADLVPLIVVAYVLQSWTGFHDLGILVKERTEFVTLANWAGAAVALLCYAWLVPRFLGWGAAVGTVLGFGVREWVVYAMAQRLWPIRLDWPPVLRLVGLSLAVGGGSLLLPDLTLGASLTLRTGLLVVYGGLLWRLEILPAGGRRALERAARHPLRTLRSLRAGP